MDKSRIPDEWLAAAGQGKTADLLKHLNAQDARQLREILADPARTKEILNSAQAKAVLEALRKKGRDHG